MIMSNHDKLIVIIHMNRTSFDALADAYEWLRLLRLGPFGLGAGASRSFDIPTAALSAQLGQNRNRCSCVK